jgi:dipeptidase E
VRLYLSSYRLGSDPSALRRADGVGRAAIVLNALDGFGQSRSRDLPRERADVGGLGYACEELDLREHFDDPAGLVSCVAGLDLLWVVGGNSFVLARAMTRARLRRALDQRVTAPGFMYAGYSAGACVAGPDLRGIDLVDDPAVVPPGYPADGRAQTLGLVPFRIVPHHDSDHSESPRIAAQLHAAGLEHRLVHDGQALLVNGEDVTVVGAASAPSTARRAPNQQP